MSQLMLLSQRAVREVWRIPEATFTALFIPVFFLVVNIGQVNNVFPADSTDFLMGQSYVAFQLPVSLVFAVSTATSGLAMVNDIDDGYLDKLLMTPVRRSSVVQGRLAADLVRGLMVSTVVLIFGLLLGARIESGLLGAIALIVLSACWGVAYAGFAIFVALRSKSVQTTNASFLIFFPLLFLTPNFVPFEVLTEPLQTIARLNPVSYVIVGLRSLILEGWNFQALTVCVLVIVASGAILTGLSLRAIKHISD